MSRQTLIWTALPNGIGRTDGNPLNLCVHLAPRLMTDSGHDGHLDPDFPDFIDWPRTVSNIAFEISFGGGPPVTIAPNRTLLDSTLWNALFKRSTTVRSHRFRDEFATRRIRSYPVNEVHKTVRQIHQTMIRGSGTALPAYRDLNLQGRAGMLAAPGGPPLVDLLPLATNAEVDGLLARELEDIFGSGRAVKVAQIDNYARQVAFYPGAIEAKRNQLNFYQLRKFHEFNPRPGANKAPVPPPKFDFHDVVSAIARFPRLLRPLGLAFDLVVPVPGNLPVNADVRVTPTGLPLNVPTQHTSPRTRYHADPPARLFVTAANGSEIVDGVLRPGASEYNLVQIDVDGAALKLTAMASNVTLAQQTGRTSLDTPTETGMPAPRTSGFSVACTDRAQKLADTLTKGKQQNDSLATDPRGDKLFLAADDVTRGFVVDVHDSVTGAWHSLCGRRGTYTFLDINQSHTFDDEGLISAPVTEPADGAPDLHHHESLFHWQGWSLAIPRPGGIVDKDSKPATPSHPAGPDYRMEVAFAPRKDLPLPRLRYGWSYQFRLRAVDLAGNCLPIETATDPAASLPQVPTVYRRYDPVTVPFVLARENLEDAQKHSGESFEHVVIRSNYDKPFGGPAERHVAPPKASQLLAETHGMFDDPVTGKLDPNAYDLIIATDKSFDKDAVHPEAQLSLPYLPDPLARGAGLLFTGGPLLNTALKVPFDGAWPQYRPLRLSLVEGSGPPSFDSAQRVLTVELRKAEQATLQLSCYLDKPDLELMGAWQDALLDAPSDFDAGKATDQAIAGQLWTLTPFRELKLVHAVQQPLLEPKFQHLTVTRALGDTFARVSDEFPIHGKSTIKVALEAEWTEQIDDLTSDTAPTIRSAGAKPFEIQQAISHDVAILAGRHEFHDTKYRKVNYQAVATTRFREYFPAEVTADEQNITRRSPAVTVDVLNSAPPPAPRVLYVLPTFVWQESSDKAWLTRTRRSGGVRVYLDRPWYSSGDGELLGVALWNCAPPRQDASVGLRFVRGGEFPIPVFGPETPQVPEHLKPYVTQWAMDPIFDGEPTPAQTTPYFEHFRNAVATEVDLPLLETGEFTVAVAGHAVKFDGVERTHAGRKLWYCDIDIDAGNAYFPFIRLALARFQPKSVRGAHLSRVVLADFVQLTADRSASISFDGADATSLTVAVCGPAPRDPPAGPASRVIATVEVKSLDPAGREVWFPSPAVELRHAVANSTFPAALWTASLALPAPHGSKEMRLVIKEYERLTADAGDRSNINASGAAERLVYADAIKI
jgi:hypothetical protein